MGSTYSMGLQEGGSIVLTVISVGQARRRLCSLSQLAGACSRTQGVSFYLPKSPLCFSALLLIVQLRAAPEVEGAP